MQNESGLRPRPTFSAEPSEVPTWDLADEARRIGQILFRHRWLLMTTWIVTTVCALVYSRYQEPKFRATATLILESEVPQLSELDPRAQSMASDKFFQSQVEVIRSYAVAERAYHRLGIEDTSEPPDDSDPILGFRQSFSVEPVKKSQLVRIHRVGNRPERVAAAVNALAEAYVEYNLEDRHRSSNDAFVWLSEQLRVLESQVAEAEEKLLAFQAQEDILSLDRQRSLLEERLSGWSERRTQANIRRLELETLFEQLDSLRGKPGMLESLPQALQSPTVQKLKDDYLTAKLEMAEESTRLKPRHPEILRLAGRIESLTGDLASEIDKVTRSIEVDYRLSLTTEQTIQRTLEELKRQSARLAQQGIEYAVLQREAESNRQMYDVMLQRLKETDIGGKITVNNVRIVDAARVPTAPIGLSSARLPLSGALLGLFLGPLLCLLVDLVDNALRNEEDVELYLQTPVIGVIPREKRGALGSAHFLHAYRNIKTHLGFYAKEHLLKCLLITSSVPGEGKTTSLVQLGHAFAQGGAKVLLVDADLYRPRLRQLYGIASEAGLTDLVGGRRDSDEVIVATETPGLHILPSGLLPPDPAAILGSESLRRLLTELREDYDIVLLEAAPLGAGLESATLGSMVDGIALVVRAESTSRAAVKKSIRRLEELRGNVLGVILTAVHATSEDSLSYYPSYGASGMDPGRVEVG